MRSTRPRPVSVRSRAHGSARTQTAPTIPSIEGVTLTSDKVDVAALAKGRVTLLLFGFRDFARVRWPFTASHPASTRRLPHQRHVTGCIAQPMLMTYATPFLEAYREHDNVAVYEVRCHTQAPAPLALT